MDFGRDDFNLLSKLQTITNTEEWDKLMNLRLKVIYIYEIEKDKKTPNIENLDIYKLTYNEYKKYRDTLELKYK